MRGLYNACIDSAVPGAYIILAAVAMFLAAALNGFLFTQRGKFRERENKKEEEEENNEIEL